MRWSVLFGGMASESTRTGAVRQIVADRLSMYRKKMGISQLELARRSGVGRTTIFQVERGEQSPQARTLRLLAAQLDVSVQDLNPHAETEVDADGQ